jgi:hypothetical protein
VYDDQLRIEHDTQVMAHPAGGLAELGTDLPDRGSWSGLNGKENPPEQRVAQDSNHRLQLIRVEGSIGHLLRT